MKWKEFKEFVESKGINDNTEILYIDTNPHFDGTDLEVILRKNNEAYIQ